MRTGRPRQPLEVRIRGKYVVDAETGCWLWIGTRNAQGYGLICEGGPNGGRVIRAHRAMYELLVGPIPEGLTLDHLCHSRAVPDCKGGVTCPHRACVNPDHLEAVTRAENLRRGEPHNRPTCPRGHAKTAENTRVRMTTRGTIHRTCRLCETERRRSDQARAKRQAYKAANRARTNELQRARRAMGRAESSAR